MDEIIKIYEILLDKYGYQGWWPIVNNKRCVYHPNDYSFPKNNNQLFEICLGAILTQNTSWKNVEKALVNLNNLNLINPSTIIDVDIDILKKAIQSAGYYNQKAKKIKIFADFFINMASSPTREELLNLWGIGPETADSILLYGFKKPYFVVDTYTKRFFSRLGLIKTKDYHIIQDFFHNSFQNFDVNKKIKIYNEFHALIVEHAKQYCKKKSNCKNCFLKNKCNML